MPEFYFMLVVDERTSDEPWRGASLLAHVHFVATFLVPVKTVQCITRSFGDESSCRIGLVLCVQLELFQHLTAPRVFPCLLG